MIVQWRRLGLGEHFYLLATERSNKYLIKLTATRAIWSDFSAGIVFQDDDLVELDNFRKFTELTNAFCSKVLAHSGNFSTGFLNEWYFR